MVKVYELIKELEKYNPHADLVAAIFADKSEAPIDGVSQKDNYNEVYIDVGLW